MNFSKIRNFVKHPMVFVGGCFFLAAAFGLVGNLMEPKAHAQPAQGYWSPVTVWGTGVGGTTNAFYGNVTNIVRINNTANRLGDMMFQYSAQDLTAAAASNTVIQLGRSLTPITPTNAAGVGGINSYQGIELFAQLPLLLNGVNTATVCTNFGADNTAFGGANPAYYYIMWCSNASSATTMNGNPMTNVTITVYTP